MRDVWPHDVVLDALRQELASYARLRPFVLVDVRLAGDDLVVVFDWRQHPARFMVRTALPDADGPVDDLVADVEGPTEWASEIALDFVEDTGTGAAFWWPRRASHGLVELIRPREANAWAHATPEIE